MKTLHEKRETALRNFTYRNVKTLATLQRKFAEEQRLCELLGVPGPTLEKFKRIQRMLP
jgi:hypothetical protein